MSFLAPWFLLGALAVALPVLFHLIRRTTRERRPFSSLMFLQTTPPRVTRRSRLEHLLLLLLRCLVLALLALGFARPFLQRFAAATPEPAAGRVVVLVDTSASMRRSGLWDEARTRLTQVLARAAPADQVAVFTFDRELRRLVPFEQWSAWNAGERATLAARRLAGVAPGWADTHLGAALVAAAEALEEAARLEQAGGSRRIVVLSDLQEGSRLDGLPGYEWPRGLEVSAEPLKPKRPTNAGLQLVAERDEGGPTPAEAPVRVRVSNSADARREQFQVGWAGPAGRAPAGPLLDVYVPPGQSRVIAAPQPVEGADRLVLWGDDEEFDNTVWVAPPRSQEVTVLFLGDDGPDDPAGCLYYLRRAFQETRRQSVRVRARPAGATLAPSDAAEAPLIIVTDPWPKERCRQARHWLTEGRTVLLVAKSTAAAALLAGLVDSGPVSVEEATVEGFALLAEVDFGHPLLAPFADPRFSDFTKIHFWRHRRLATNTLPGARVLARFDSGAPALLEVPVGRGRLLVLAAGWQPADSQLALSSKFVPLLYSLLELSGGEQARRGDYLVGQPVFLPRPADQAAARLTVRKPDGLVVEVAGDGGPFAQTDQPGIYTVTPTQPPLRFAVNLAPEESQTAPLPLEELERLGVPLRLRSDLATREAMARQARLRAVELENRQRLWRWLLLTALAVLVVETWLAGRTRPATPTAAGEAPAGAAPKPADAPGPGS